MLAYYVLKPNPPKKTKAAKRKPMAARKKTRRKTRARKRPSRRKTRARKRTARKRPARRKTRRKKTAARRSTRRRRRRNPVRVIGGSRKGWTKRYRRKGPKGGPYKYRRKRGNPGVRGTFRGFMRRVQQLWSVDTLTAGVQATVGFSAALIGPDQIAQLIRQPQWARGIPGVILSGISSAAAATIAGLLGFGKAANKIMVGGLVATALRALIQILPAQITSRWLPLQRLQSRALPAPSAAPGVSGMGLISAEQLISPARQLGMRPMGSYLHVRNGVGSYMSAGEPVSNIQSAEEFGQSNLNRYSESF